MYTTHKYKCELKVANELFLHNVASVFHQLKQNNLSSLTKNLDAIVVQTSPKASHTAVPEFLKNYGIQPYQRMAKYLAYVSPLSPRMSSFV